MKTLRKIWRLLTSGWTRSLRLYRTQTKVRVTNVLTASLISSALMGGLAMISLRFFGSDPRDVLVAAIPGAILMTMLIVMGDDNNDLQGR